jgi:hypothetical protein
MPAQEKSEVFRTAKLTAGNAFEALACPNLCTATQSAMVHVTDVLKMSLMALCSSLVRSYLKDVLFVHRS